MALSGLCLVGVTGVVRWLGSELNPIQAAFIRYAFGLLIVIPIFLKMGMTGIRSSRVGLLAGRGAVHGLRRAVPRDAGLPDLDAGIIRHTH